MGPFTAILANPVVAAAAMNAIDLIVGIVTKRNQGEITEAQALQALQLASSSVEGAFKDWHAAKHPTEG